MLCAVKQGANSGLGKETVRVLALTGAHVILAVRNADAAKEQVAELKKASKNEHVEALSLDLGDTDSIFAFVKKFNERKLPLNILVNNAGVYGPTNTTTKQVSSKQTVCMDFDCFPAGL